MTPKVTHKFTFTLGPIDDNPFDRSADLAADIVTRIGRDGGWRVHPEGDERWVGVGPTLVLAVLDHLRRRLGG